MIKDFFIYLGLGLVLLVLQATWLYGEWINPFRLDLVFILIVFIATQDQLGMGLILSALLGLWVDILSWGILGLSMTLYPLLLWIYHSVWVRTNIQSLLFKVFSVLILQVLYCFLTYFFEPVFQPGFYKRAVVLKYPPVGHHHVGQFTSILPFPGFLREKACYGLTDNAPA